MKQQLAMGMVVAVSLLTSGCSREATGQTVAVVNDEEVSQAELNAELAAANVPNNADKKQVLPQLVQRIVDRKLLAQAAVEEGIDRSPDYITRQRRMNEELLIGLMTQRRAESIKLPTATEVDKFIESNPAMFQQRQILSLDQIFFDPPANPTVLKQLEGTHSLLAVGETLQKLGIQYNKAQGKLDTGSLNSDVAGQILRLPAGEPFIVPAGGKIVVSVITGRQTAATPAEQSRKIAAEVIRRQKLTAMIEARVKELRSSGKISYQPGFAPPAAKK